MTVLLSLFGGMALLLYGIRLSGEALQRALGGRLRKDRKSTRLNSSHIQKSRMPSSA